MFVKDEEKAAQAGFDIKTIWAGSECDYDCMPSQLPSSLPAQISKGSEARPQEPLK